MLKDKITPTHTLDWYIKWVATLFVLAGMVATAQNIYPYNMFLTVIGEVGWFTVAYIWRDRALLTLTSIASFILISGIIKWAVI